MYSAPVFPYPMQTCIIRVLCGLRTSCAIEASMGAQIRRFLPGYTIPHRPEGNNTVFNVPTIIAIKRHNIQMNQAADPEFHFTPARFVASFTEIAFLLKHDKTGINLYYRLVLAQSKLPPKLAPCGSPGDGRGPRKYQRPTFGAIPIFAGHNDAQGNFVPDTPPPTPFDAHPMPGGLVNTTGIFKKNVDILSTHANMLRNGIHANVDSAPGKIWSWDSAMRRDQSTYAAHYSKNKCAWEQHRQYACSEFESTLEEKKLTTDVPTTTSIIFSVLSSHLSRDEATALYPKSAWALMGVSKSA
ncbi:hypothetical protein C8J57DRAFT_1666003 [Mycena rebaudengoi]|nr:hypothetical protein C8J57DRAFT_1666003 [Mycena rebaudengoi]